MSTSPRIERGAALLDQHAPGWTTKIDLDALDLGSEKFCVLGQLYGHYEHGLDRIDGDLDWATSDRYGFTTMANEYYSNLTAKWRRYIKARRES